MQHLYTGEAALQAKHANQMRDHQSRFGRLGRPQNARQKKAMARANKELEAAGYIAPVSKP